MSPMSQEVCIDDDLDQNVKRVLQNLDQQCKNLDQRCTDLPTNYIPERPVSPSMSSAVSVNERYVSSTIVYVCMMRTIHYLTNTRVFLPSVGRMTCTGISPMQTVIRVMRVNSHLTRAAPFITYRITGTGYKSLSSTL